MQPELAPDDGQQEWIQRLKRRTEQSDKSWTLTLILSVFAGIAGLDRMYLGSLELGFMKLLTCGGLAVWWLLDVGLILAGRMRDADGRRVRRGR